MIPALEALRVMQFVTVFESGGTERQFINLGLALDERGHDVRFGCIRRSGRLLHELESRGLPIQEYAVRSFYSARFPRAQWRLARDLARARVQIVHAYNLYGNVFAVPAARLAGVPVVIAAIRDRGAYLTAWTRRVQRAVCRLADHVLVNAASIKEWLVDDGYSADKISVIRNGIDLSRFLTPSKTATAIREDFHIPDTAPLLTFVARLCPSKGCDDLIDAMAVVKTRRPDARLLVVGEGLKSTAGQLHVDHAYRDTLRRRADALGVGDRVMFTGYRSDIPAILQAATVAVQPSWTEGLSNSVLESMAAGAAVVATPVGGTPEVITHDKTGWIVPAHDPRGLGEAISRLIDDPARRHRLGEAARHFVRETLSIEEMVRQTEAIYRALLRNCRRHRARANRLEATTLGTGR